MADYVTKLIGTAFFIGVMELLLPRTLLAKTALRVLALVRAAALIEPIIELIS